MEKAWLKTQVKRLPLDQRHNIYSFWLFRIASVFAFDRDISADRTKHVEATEDFGDFSHYYRLPNHLNHSQE
jgi:hypothetical protein